MKLVIVAACSLLCLFAGDTARASADDFNRISGKRWTIARYLIGGRFYSLSRATSRTEGLLLKINRSNKRFRGHTGLNNIRGKIVLDPHRCRIEFKLDKVGENIGNVEETNREGRYLRMLSRVKTYRLRGGKRMILRSANGENQMTFFR